MLPLQIIGIDPNRIISFNIFQFAVVKFEWNRIRSKTKWTIMSWQIDLEYQYINAVQTVRKDSTTLRHLKNENRNDRASCIKLWAKHGIINADQFFAMTGLNGKSGICNWITRTDGRMHSLIYRQDNLINHIIIVTQGHKSGWSDKETTTKNGIFHLQLVVFHLLEALFLLGFFNTKSLIIVTIYIKMDIFARSGNSGFLHVDKLEKWNKTTSSHPFNPLIISSV